jgi:hypothetical protein
LVALHRSGCEFEPSDSDQLRQFCRKAIALVFLFWMTSLRGLAGKGNVINVSNCIGFNVFNRHRVPFVLTTKPSTQNTSLVWVVACSIPTRIAHPVGPACLRSVARVVALHLINYGKHGL